MISLPFLKRKGSTVGLDIGSSHVKVIEIDHSGSRPKITHFGLTALPPEAIVEGEIMDRDLVIAGIKECIEKAGVTATDVVTAISGRAVIVKKVVMDKMSADDAQEAIFWEAEQHVPFDIDDVCLDFQILKDDIGANQMEVLLVAAKKDMINTHANLIKDAGFTPTVIDVDSFAVQNCFEGGRGIAADEDSKKVIGLVNIGSNVTNINIIQDASPHFTRDISVGSNNFAEVIQKELEVDYEEAQKNRLRRSRQPRPREDQGARQAGIEGPLSRHRTQRRLPQGVRGRGQDRRGRPERRRGQHPVPQGDSWREARHRTLNTQSPRGNRI